MLPLSLRFDNITPAAAPKGPGSSVKAHGDGPVRCLYGADTVESGSDGPLRCLDGADTVEAGADGPLRCLDGADTVEAGADGPLRCLDGAETDVTAGGSWGGWNIAS